MHLQAREQGRVPQVEDLGDAASDPSLLNAVQKQLNDWKKAILSVTRLDRYERFIEPFLVFLH